jgi:tetratricopeptide (TPR) repeat protein
MTKLSMMAAAAALFLAAPFAGADQKLDQAVAKAEEQIQKGKPEEALKGMQKFADSANSGEGFLALARILEKTGDVEAAAAAASRAVSASLGNASVKADALAAVANYELLRGSSKEALARAEEAVKTASSATSLAALARAEARAKEGVSALATADKAVAASGTSAVAHEARGDALVVLAKYGDAAAAYRKALELDAKNHRPRVGLTRALALDGKAAEAVAEARKATELDPKSGEAFAALGLALALEAPEKNWNDAIAQAQQGVFLNPRSALANIVVGRIFDLAGNVDQAIAAYRKALEVDPGNGTARVALINNQARKGDNEGALLEAQKLVAENPNNAEGQLLVARALIRKGDFAAAAPALEKAAQLAPGVAEAHALLGTAYQYNRRSEEALASYRKAVELAPTNLDYRTTFGLLLGLAGKYDEGVAELRKVVSNPTYKNDDGWINLGWVYRNMTPPRIDDSVAAYKKALEIDPKNVQPALGMGWAYSYGKNWDGSIAAFQQAVKIDPKTAGEAYNGMAWAYFFKKDLAQAKDMAEKARAAGREDARLATNIERMEKVLAGGGSAAEADAAAAAAQAAYEEARKAQAKVEEVNAGLRSGNAGARRRALQSLPSVIGAQDSLPYLIRALREDPDYGVREGAVAALKGIGCGARIALPHLKYVITGPKNECLQCSKEELNEMMRDEDLRRSARDAVAKIEACK